jgi:hypothetical protein
MPSRLPRPLLAAILAVFALVAAFAAPAAAAERSWVKVACQPDVPAAARDNIEAALDTIADLLGEYRIYLTQTVTVVVSDGPEGYVRALMSYGYTREAAEEKAKHTAGISLNQRPVIILKGSPALMGDRQEVYRVLPHELFHQVQRQWGRLDTVNWMVEAAPELFRIKAADRAGFAPAAVFLGLEQLKIRRAQAIPSAHQLASKNYAAFSSLASKGYPVYPMATLMLAKLVEDGGFDKVIYFYQLLHHGSDPDKAFLSVFRAPMGMFLTDMDTYFASLRP